MAQQWFCIQDSRSGRRASITSFDTQESARRQIEAWRDRDAKGGRPDIHDLMPYLVVVPSET